AAVHHLSSLPVTGEVVRALTMEVLGMRALARLPAEVRGELPDIVEPRPARAPRRWSDARLAVPRPSGGPRCSRDYVDAYAAGRTTPERVAERALEELGRFGNRTPSMNVLAACDPEAVREAARAAAARWARGQARPLEGVPFLVKDQLDVVGLPTRFGSSHGALDAAADASVVAR